MQQRMDLDRVGAVASFVCAVHCAAIPILLGLGAAGAVSWFDHPGVEWALVGLAAVVGSFSAWRGYRVHRNLPVAIVLAGAALALLAVTAITHDGHGAHDGHDHGHDHSGGAHTGSLKWVFPVLGLAIAVAHVVNRRLVHASEPCTDHSHSHA